MTKKKKTNELKIVEKNRKPYIRIKTINGKLKYYKFNPNIPIDTYREYAKNPEKKIKEYKKEWKQKLIERETKKENKIRKIKPKGTLYIKRGKPKILENTLKQGLTITTIKNIHTAGTEEYRKAYRELLKPLILDKQLLKMLATEETISKLRYRIEQKYTFNGNAEVGRENYDSIEERLGGAISIGKTTPQQGAREIIEILSNNQLFYVHNDQTSATIKKLEQKGYNYKHIQNGSVNRTDLTIIFRKG